jgi:hypothetical protein
MSHPTVESAIASGRILPRSRKKYERLMASNPKKTRKFLKSLAPALAGRSSTATELADSDDTAYPTNALTPRERERIAASRYDTARSAAASPPVPAASVAPSASAPIPPTDEAYPAEWLLEKERTGATSGRVTIAND